MTVTKETLREVLYAELGLRKSEAKALVEAFFEGIRVGLLQDGEVKLSGFGVFSVREKRARPGRNPQNGEPYEISARRVVTFHPSTLLKEHCNPELQPSHQRQ